MFECAITFNQDISSWKVSKVKNMNKMFYLASSYSKWMFNWEPTYVVNTCNSTKVCDTVSDILSCSGLNFMNKIDDMAEDWGLKRPCNGTLRIGQYCDQMLKTVCGF